MQIANYFFPLITIPYIANIFGPNLFGTVNFAIAFIAYSQIIINYGFDLSATREIAQNRDDEKKIERIFNYTIFSKIFLCIVTFFLLMAAIIFVDVVRQYYMLYLLLFFGNVAGIFFPTWFFQGMEKLTISSVLSFIVKFIFSALIFILIKSKDDLLLYPVCILFGQIVSSAISVYLIIKKYGIKIKIPTMDEIKITLKSSWHLFFTTLTINLYTTTNIVLLGFLASSYEVGIFSAAQKIVSIFMAIIAVPIGQALYPSIGYSFSKSYKTGISKIIKTLIIIIPITIIPSMVLYLFPDIFVHILFGEKFNGAIFTLKILSFLPFIIALSNLFGVQGLINIKKERNVNYITICGAILGLSCNVYLVPKYGYNGTAFSWLITETVITILLFMSFVRNTNFIEEVKTSFIKTFRKEI